MSDGSIVIIGAGQAGGCAAATLRETGYAGKIVLIGKETHPPYERPPLSKGLLSGEAPLSSIFLRERDWYTESKIDLQLGTGVEEIRRDEKYVRTEHGTEIPYDKLLITTGARARKLAIPGSADAGLIYLRNLDDTLLLRDQLTSGREVAIIGAGFIGLELAATAIKLGCQVRVFEVGPAPLGRVAPGEIADAVLRLHSEQGVRFNFRTAVTAIDRRGQGYSLHLENGNSVEADLVIVGIGAVPNDELAKEAGLEVADGIIVDEFGQTSDSSIFAAGDVTRHYNPLLKRQIRLEAWQNAQNQAIAVAKNMAGESTAFAEVPWLWSDQFDLNLQIAGYATEWDSLVWRGHPNEKQSLAFQLMGDALVGAIALNNTRDMRFARQLIASGRKVTPEQLADKSYKLQDLCRS